MSPGDLAERPATRLQLRGWVTCGPAVRRVLEQSPELELVDMDWDERWAEVRFCDPGWGVEELRLRMMPAGAWCAPVQRQEGGE